MSIPSSDHEILPSPLASNFRNAACSSPAVLRSGDGEAAGEALISLSVSVSMSVLSTLRDVEVLRRLKERVDSFVGRLLLPLVEDLERRRFKAFAADFWRPLMQFTSFGKYIFLEFKLLSGQLFASAVGLKNQRDSETQCLLQKWLPFI